MITHEGSDEARNQPTKTSNKNNFIYLDVVYLGSSGSIDKAATHRAHTVAISGTAPFIRM